jgi:hypothetical protein
MDPMKMTHEQWNGLVALIRAVAVAAARQGDMDAKRQAGACEAQVRRMFVTDES